MKASPWDLSLSQYSGLIKWWEPVLLVILTKLAVDGLLQTWATYLLILWLLAEIRLARSVSSPARMAGSEVVERCKECCNGSCSCNKTGS